MISDFAFDIAAERCSKISSPEPMMKSWTWDSLKSALGLEI